MYFPPSCTRVEYGTSISHSVGHAFIPFRYCRGDYVQGRAERYSSWWISALDQVGTHWESFFFVVDRMIYSRAPLPRLSSFPPEFPEQLAGRNKKKASSRNKRSNLIDGEGVITCRHSLFWLPSGSENKRSRKRDWMNHGRGCSWKIGDQKRQLSESKLSYSGTHLYHAEAQHVNTKGHRE